MIKLVRVIYDVNIIELAHVIMTLLAVRNELSKRVRERLQRISCVFNV